MSALITFLPLLLSILLVACFVKLAARVFRRTKISWKHCLAFTGLSLVLTIASQFLIPAAPAFIPSWLEMVLGVAAFVAFGAWFFKGRAVSSEGVPLNYSGAAKLTALTAALGMLVCLPLLAVLTTLMPR